MPDTTETLRVLTPSFRRILVQAYISDATRHLDEIEWGVSSRDHRLVMDAASELGRKSNAAGMSDVVDACQLLVGMAETRCWSNAPFIVAQIQIEIADMALSVVRIASRERAKA